MVLLGRLRGIEVRFRCETVEAKKVLYVNVFPDHLYRLFIADVLQVLHHQSSQNNARIDVRGAR